MSGRDPGELGIYGFRNRASREYGKMAVADSRAVAVPRLWDHLSQAGWRVAVVGVPGTYPPPAVNGALVSCFLAPNTSVQFTHPPELAQRMTAWLLADGGQEPEDKAQSTENKPPESVPTDTEPPPVPSSQSPAASPYLLDVPDFRTEDKARILRDIYTLCDQRFAVATKLLEEDAPDFLMLVDMGTDRIHHAFWKAMDVRHPLHVAGDPYAGAIHAYYQHLDAKIGALLAHTDRETVVLVVSDHGARPLMGGIRLNEWLRTNSYLALKSEPTGTTSIDKADIDWPNTRAWGAGGYYGRVFLNVRGREPQGIIAPADYERERTALAEQLAALPGPDGQPLGTRVFTPQQLYQKVRGIAPDLLVYFGDLAWRAVGTVGGGDIYTQENDTGPDDANHAQHGLFILADPRGPHGQTSEDAQIYDILPTLLQRFSLPVPNGLRGKRLGWLVTKD